MKVPLSKMALSYRIRQFYSPELRSEQGAVLFFAALLLSGIAVLVVGLAVDVSKVKQGRIEADRLALEACSGAADSMPNIPAAAERIALNTNLALQFRPLPQRLSVAEIRIVTPTIGEDLIFPSPHVPGPDLPLSELLLNSRICVPNSGGCSLVAMSTLCPLCKFLGDLSPGNMIPGSDPSKAWVDNYPAGFIGQEDFGNFIGCEVEIDVNTFTEGVQRVTGRAFFALKPPDESVQGPALGLIIGVAPYADIPDAAEPSFNRFKFDTYTGGTFTDHLGNPDSDFDPLVAFDPSPNPPVNPETGNPGNLGFSALRPTTLAFSGTLVGSEATSGNSRRELLASCANPFVAARNLVVATIVEHIARLASYRDNTEILLIPPKNYTSTGGYADYSAHNLPPSSSEINKPIRIVDFGDDLLRRDYQLPFVNFKPSGLGGDYTPDSSLDDYLCAYDGAGCSDSLDQDERAKARMVINQLRDCWHVYHEGNQQLPTLSFASPSMTHPFNDSFHPPEHTKVMATSSVYREGSNSWDQQNVIDNMSAPELLSRLGSIQRCPTDGLCEKPDNLTSTELTPETELTPDYVGFFNYVNRLGQAVQKYDTPGFLPRVSPSFSPALEALPITRDQTHVFLIISKLPTLRAFSSGASLTNEQTMLQSLINNFTTTNPNRKLTILFIPTTAKGVCDSNSSSYLNEFRDLVYDSVALAPIGSGAPTRRYYSAWQEDYENLDKKIYYLMPTHCRYKEAGASHSSIPNSPPLAAATDQDFVNFWMDLLNPIEGSPGANAWEIAEFIFRERFAEPTLGL